MDTPIISKPGNINDMFQKNQIPRYLYFKRGKVSKVWSELPPPLMLWRDKKEPKISQPSQLYENHVLVVRLFGSRFRVPGLFCVLSLYFFHFVTLLTCESGTWIVTIFFQSHYVVEIGTPTLPANQLTHVPVATPQ